VIGVALAVGGAFALAGAAFESKKWRHRLRMSLDELKRDLRQNEGDPSLRLRRRRAHGGLVRGSIGRLREAAFVVANPSHIAIALAYRPPQIAVPRVVVRATDEAALFVRRRAAQLGIPVVEDVTLARALFATSEPDAFIPRELYEDIARIVAVLLQQRKLQP
jgi:flagellar biosynthesis protein FlhB